MLRRSHKKSRGGCVQCKRRHVKCDEGRPTCLMCSMSGRECSFASQPQPDTLQATQSKKACSRSTSPASNPERPNSQTVSSNSHSHSPIDQTVSSEASRTPSLDEPVNLRHMELIVHFTTVDLFLDKNIFEHSFSSSLSLSQGLKWPFLLHQILALSARHLAYLHPKSAAAYKHQAMALQTRAISLFNSSWKEVNESNCVAILLFSSLLGHHLLADTLAARGPGGLDAFMTQYMQCVETHTGIYTIAISAWPDLMKSELEPILSWSSTLMQQEPKGDHCQELWGLIDKSDTITDSEKESCRLAIRYLQLGFDTITAPVAENERGNHYQMILSWLTLAEQDFKKMLAAKRPEALVMLSYYALLLHYSKNVWIVEDSGQYVLGIIFDYLTPEWRRWLDYPCQMMAADSD